ncbi:hypothetical protein [Flagellimonas flava]|uniref:Lipoprotein n=1 Tax=Flagellimonas flava TaxID=570519 RepID=A0A1M5M8I5_9FLAO|nr:hypothetical protein [Allomuricauda flava]SHG73587.1 hypothetical protein SAMN04488116_2317 [Allomuricauda flava]
MRKLSCILLLFLTFFSCKEKEQSPDQNSLDTLEFDYQKMPKRTGINPEATEILNEWSEFQDFNSSFTVLYKATNNEDLVLAIDELIKKEEELAKSEYPETFDEFQIKSRQRVVKTYLFKVKASIVNNTKTTEPTIEMIKAYNAFRAQLNVLVNSQLDKKLILDES